MTTSRARPTRSSPACSTRSAGSATRTCSTSAASPSCSGYDRKLNTLDYPVAPRGHRILGRIPRLPKLIVMSVVRSFGGLDELLAASDGELEAVEGVGEIRAKDIREGLRRLQEINLVDRYLQT